MNPKRSNAHTVSLDTDTPNLAAAEWLEVGPTGRLDIHLIIHHGDDITAAPTGTPVGAWQLYCAGAEKVGIQAVTPVRILAAESGANSLADLAPNGNNLVNAIANFTDVPGTRCKLLYARSTGGTGDKATFFGTKG